MKTDVINHSCKRFPNNIRFWGRFISALHLFFSHRNNHLLDSLCNLFIFIMTGKSNKMKYIYSHYCLLKVINESSNIIINEVFNVGMYDWSFPKINPVIVDIGCYLGYSTIFFQKKYPQARIFGYEPNSQITPFLQENLSHNTNLNNIFISNSAVVTDDKIPRYLYIDSVYPEASSLYQQFSVEGTEKTKVKINTTSLKEIINKLKYIDILKIDAEGSEYELLSDILHYSDKIHSIIVELHINKDEKYIDFIYQISKKYSIFISTPYFLAIDNFKLDELFHGSKPERNYLTIYAKNKKHFSGSLKQEYLT